MTNEVTVPLLPCPSIDDIETFYRALGFRTTYKQRKPNPCVGLQREDLHLQFFEIAAASSTARWLAHRPTTTPSHT